MPWVTAMISGEMPALMFSRPARLLEEGEDQRRERDPDGMVPPQQRDRETGETEAAWNDEP